ncbi:MAG: tetratricopeptide repeat protein [Bacteroidota bacterium]
MSRLAIIIFWFLIIASCNKSTKYGRFISENDTTYSIDIRSASGKIQKDPENPELYYLRGNAFFYEKKYKDAVLDLNWAISLNNQQPLYHYKLAETLLALDSAQPKQAKEHLDIALNLKPDFHEAKSLLAYLQLARLQYAEAEKLYKELQVIPDYREKALVYRAIAAKEQKDTASAINFLQLVLKENTENYDATMQYTLLLMAKRDPQALMWAKKAAAMNEFSDEALYHYGLASQWNGSFKTAMDLYERTIKLNPNHIMARYNMAVIEFDFENYRTAKTQCEEIIRMAPDFQKAIALKSKCEEYLK